MGVACEVAKAVVAALQSQVVSDAAGNRATSPGLLDRLREAQAEAAKQCAFAQRDDMLSNIPEGLVRQIDTL